MADESDIDLIRKVKKKNCSDSFVEICRRYENAYYKVCQKYKNALIFSGICPDDVFNEKNIVIYNCIKSFKISKKTKFSTWLCNHARFTCLNKINENKNLIAAETPEIAAFLENSCIKEAPIDLKEEKDFIFSVLDGLKDKRIKAIFEYRYFKEGKKKPTWQRISKKIKVSTQTVINLHDKAISLLYKKIKSERIYF